jgi:hypothetical protein
MGPFDVSAGETRPLEKSISLFSEHCKISVLEIQALQLRGYVSTDVTLCECWWNIIHRHLSNMPNAIKLVIDVIKRARGHNEAEVVWEVCDFGNSGVLMFVS